MPSTISALDVLGVDDAVGPDPSRQMHREPSACRADFGNRRSLRDPQRVHDLIGFLPLVAVGGLEQPEIDRLEQASLGFACSAATSTGEPARRGNTGGSHASAQATIAIERRRRRSSSLG